MTRLRQRDDLDQAPVADHLLVHDPRSRVVHALNPSARSVWEACTQPRTPAQVVTTVASVVGIDPGAIAGDVRDVLDALVDDGLLVDADGAAPAVGPGRDGDPRGGGDPPPTAHRAPVDPARRVPASTGADELVVEHLGRVAAIRCDHVEGRRRLEAVLGPLRANRRSTHRYHVAPDGEDRWRLDADGTELRRRAALEPVLAHLLWHLNHEAVESAAATLVLHAGAVAGRAGAVAIGGEPDAGKSTLTAACVGAGLEYLTDEATAVVVGDELRAVPYPKPMTLDATALALLSDAGLGPAGDVGPRVIGASAQHLDPRLVGEVATGPRPLTVVVLPDRRLAGGAASPPLPPVDAALALAAVAFNLDRAGTAGLRTVAALAERVPVRQLATGDLREAVATVADLADLAARAGGPEQHIGR